MSPGNSRRVSVADVVGSRRGSAADLRVARARLAPLPAGYGPVRRGSAGAAARGRAAGRRRPRQPALVAGLGQARRRDRPDRRRRHARRDRLGVHAGLRPLAGRANGDDLRRQRRWHPGLRQRRRDTHQLDAPRVPAGPGPVLRAPGIWLEPSAAACGQQHRRLRGLGTDPRGRRQGAGPRCPRERGTPRRLPSDPERRLPAVDHGHTRRGADAERRRSGVPVTRRDPQPRHDTRKRRGHRGP